MAKVSVHWAALKTNDEVRFKHLINYD